MGNQEMPQAGKMSEKIDNWKPKTKEIEQFLEENFKGSIVFGSHNEDSSRDDFNSLPSEVIELPGNDYPHNTRKVKILPSGFLFHEGTSLGIDRGVELRSRINNKIEETKKKIGKLQHDLELLNNAKEKFDQTLGKIEDQK